MPYSWYPLLKRFWETSFFLKCLDDEKDEAAEPSVAVCFEEADYEPLEAASDKDKLLKGEWRVLGMVPCSQNYVVYVCIRKNLSIMSSWELFFFVMIYLIVIANVG